MWQKAAMNKWLWLCSGYGSPEPGPCLRKGWETGYVFLPTDCAFWAQVDGMVGRCLVGHTRRAPAAQPPGLRRMRMGGSVNADGIRDTEGRGCPEACPQWAPAPPLHFSFPRESPARPRYALTSTEQWPTRPATAVDRPAAVGNHPSPQSCRLETLAVLRQISTNISIVKDRPGP